MAFDLSKYMTAEERIELFAKDNPDMRQKSEREIVDGMIYVTVILWRTWADPNPWVYGMAGESVKTQFAIEKAETSAYARAITNTGLPQYSTTVDGQKAPRANRAEMEKVVAEKEQTFKEKLEARQNIYGQSGNSKKIELALRESFAADKPKAEPVEWSVGEVVDNLPKSEPMPMPCENGKTKLLQGISKGGKPYYGHVCNCGKPKDQQCPAQWAKLSANGRWYFDGQENG
jgi:hypothetical protein